MAFGRDNELNLEATELRLGLPGTTTAHDHLDKQTISVTPKCNKRSLTDINHEDNNSTLPNLKKTEQEQETAPPTKAQVVGWPPIRSYRKNCFQAKKMEVDQSSGIYVKVSMDGAPYLRKIDLNLYKGYPELLKALQDMFKFKVGDYSEREGYNGSEYEPTYEDKDGDWMLVGDVPWNMFITSCKKLRIMKGSEARGLGSVL